MKIAELSTFLQKIQHQLETQKKLSDHNGGNFNIFSILGVESHEVKTHSSFLRELLDPEGSHAMGAKFLELFIESCGIETKLDTTNSKVTAEYHVGQIDNDYTHGGFIDLLIEDKNQTRIIIENKIDAGDQKNQLLRYHNFDSLAELLYLTIDGHPPSEDSCGGEKFEYTCKSYAGQILEWLKNCRKEAVEKPVVREALSQYIELIKKITNQTAKETMKDEIKELLIKNPAFIKSMHAINESWGQITRDVEDRFGVYMKKEFAPMKLDPIASNLLGEAKCGEDGDGVYVAFFMTKNGENICSSDLANQLFERLKAIELTMVKHNNYIGWFNPKPFKRRMRFLGLESREIIEMYQNEEIIEKLVQDIVKQTRDIWAELSKQESN